MCVARNNKNQDTIQLNETMTIETASSAGKQRVSRRRSSVSSVGNSCSGASMRSKRTYVEHNYEDHYSDSLYRPGFDDEETHTEGAKRRGPRGGVVIPFPERLNSMLCQAEEDGFEDVVSWQPHGRCFIVHQPKKFVEEVMPKFFRQSKLTSFQRQVNLYGFRRLTSGTDRGGYYHEMFLRGRPDLHKKLVRVRVKGTGFKSASSPETEPNFYSYPSCAEEGPTQMMPRSANSLSRAETEGYIELPAADLATSAPLDGPIWTPLSAPPKMIVSPQISPLKSPSLSSFGGNEMFGSPSLMSLSSIAPTLFSSREPEGSSSQPGSCPTTPKSNLRRLVSVAMVSPVESPVHSHLPLMGSLDVTMSSGSVEDLLEDLLLAPLPQGAEDFRMDTFEADVEALLSVDHTTFGGEVVDVLPAYSFDPLLMLDEVVGPD